MPKDNAPRAKVFAIGLSHEKRKALESICSGDSATTSARRAGVSRATIYRWIREDPDFSYAYNEWHKAMTECTRAKLMGIVDIAFQTIKTSVKNGDAKTAIRILSSMDVLESRHRALEKEQGHNQFYDGFHPDEKQLCIRGGRVVRKMKQTRVVGPALP